MGRCHACWFWELLLRPRKRLSQPDESVKVLKLKRFDKLTAAQQAAVIHGLDLDVATWDAFVEKRKSQLESAPLGHTELAESRDVARSGLADSILSHWASEWADVHHILMLFWADGLRKPCWCHDNNVKNPGSINFLAIEFFLRLTLYIDFAEVGLKLALQQINNLSWTGEISIWKIERSPLKGLPSGYFTIIDDRHFSSSLVNLPEGNWWFCLAMFLCGQVESTEMGVQTNQYGQNIFFYLPRTRENEMWVVFRSTTKATIRDSDPVFRWSLGDLLPITDLLGYRSSLSDQRVLGELDLDNMHN